MKILYALTAASVLTVSAFSNAETSLSQAEMDGINAAGMAFGNAVAMAYGTVANSQTGTQTSVLPIGLAPAQLGGIYLIQAVANVGATSSSDGSAVAVSTATGLTTGSLASDTNSGSMTYTDTNSAAPVAMSSSFNVSNASSNIIGFQATASSTSNSVATLANPAP